MIQPALTRYLIFAILAVLAGCGKSVDFGLPAPCVPQWPMPRIAFRSTMALSGAWDGSPTGSFNVWLVNGDGTGLFALTRNTLPGLDINPPRIAANGAKLTFFGFAAVSGLPDGASPSVQNAWTVNADGSALTAITRNTTSGDSQYTDLSPDSTHVSFASTQATGSGNSWNLPALASYNIWSAGSDGSAMAPLTRNTQSGLNSLAPLYSTDGKSIVFYSKSALSGAWDGAASLARNIWIMNSDGTSRIAITKNTGTGLDSYFPVFSLSAKKVLFSSYTALNGNWNGTATASQNLWVASADGAQLTALTRNTLAGLDVAAGGFSPDEIKVVFSAALPLSGAINGAPTSSANIWSVNVDGSGLTPLTRNTASSLDSAGAFYSNDGTRIYFYSKMPLNGAWNGPPSPSQNLFVMNADGSGLSAVTRNTQAALDSFAFNLSQVPVCSQKP